MPVIVNIDIELDIVRVLCRQGVGGSGKTAPQVMALSRKLLAGGAWRDLLQPAIACETYRVVACRQEGLELESGRVFECHLPGYRAAELAVAVGTIGPKLEQEVAHLFVCGEPLKAVLLDGLGNAALDCVVREASKLVAHRAAGVGYKMGNPIMPGSKVLPLSEQAKVFELAGAGEIGMKLSSSGGMAPLKSISMVMVLGPDVPAWSENQTLCHACEMADKCGYREP